MAITGAPARFPAGRRILTYENPSRYTESSDELTVSSSDSVFGFLEGSVESTTSSEGDIFEVEEEEEENSGNSFEENKKFWENQYHLLQATMCRTTGVETGIRSLTKEALKEIQAEGGYCKCRKPVTGNNCRICLMKEVCGRLNNAGFNCAVCRSKWRSSSEIPSGEHICLDVIDNSSSKKGEVRVIIELNFRAEFQMARASEDYDQLISRLPEVFVGKDERLRALIKILCLAAKKCMKDKKMHLGPWRKHKYMQAKWFSPYERMEANTTLKDSYSKKTSKPTRASMLTMALLDMPCKAVAVV